MKRKSIFVSIFVGVISIIIVSAITSKQTFGPPQDDGDRGGISFSQDMLADYARKEAGYRKAAEQGDIQAQFTLAIMYEGGLGVSQDRAEAVKWWRKAADQGSAYAQFMLGGMSKDDAEAVKWYRKAAEQGNSDAQQMLGIMYERGSKGVPQDYTEAAKWWRKAADQQGKLNNLFNIPARFALAYIWLKEPFAAHRHIPVPDPQTLPFPPPPPR